MITNPLFKKSQASIHQHLSDWEYRLWTDSDLDNFVRERFPDFYPSWAALEPHIKKVDTARYFLLYEFGGLYADLDFVFVQSIDDLLDDRFGLYFYKSTQAIAKGWNFLGNAFMMSKSGEKFWLDALAYMFALPRHTPVLNHTGPLALGAFSALSFYPAPIKVFGPDLFDNEACADGVGKRTYGYHARAATWQHPELR